MDQTELARLNRILGDSLGRNPQDEPIFKWMRSEDVRLPMKTDESLVLLNGIYRPEPKYTWEPTYDAGCWVLAMWHFSEPDEWITSFGNEVPWPQHGLHYVTDMILLAGIEPNETATYDAVQAVKQLRVTSIADHLYNIRAKRARLEKQGRDELYEYLTSKATAFGNIPGKRGGTVSFGGI